MSMDIYGSTNDIHVQTSTMFYAISFKYIIKGLRFRLFEKHAPIWYSHHYKSWIGNHSTPTPNQRCDASGAFKCKYNTMNIVSARPVACPNICIDWFWYCNIARNYMFLLWFESMIPMDLGILWEGTWHCLTPNNDAPNAHKSKVCWLKHALIYRHLLFRSIIGMIWLHISLYISVK